MRDESRLTTDGGPELPGRGGGGSQRHSHGWSPVVSDQGSGGAWSPQSSLERRRAKEQRRKGVSRRKSHVHNNHSLKISHNSRFSIKTKELRIKHPKHHSLHLYPSYIMTSPIVEAACETLILSEIQCPGHQDYKCYGISVI